MENESYGPDCKIRKLECIGVKTDCKKKKKAIFEYSLTKQWGKTLAMLETCSVLCGPHIFTYFQQMRIHNMSYVQKENCFGVDAGGTNWVVSPTNMSKDYF
jgi:hypothetical protein